MNTVPTPAQNQNLDGNNLSPLLSENVEEVLYIEKLEGNVPPGKVHRCKKNVVNYKRDPELITLFPNYITQRSGKDNYVHVINYGSSTASASLPDALKCDFRGANRMASYAFDIPRMHGQLFVTGPCQYFNCIDGPSFKLEMESETIVDISICYWN